MLSTFRKAVWGLASKLGTFKGKERLVRLISRPRSLGAIQVKRENVSWLIQGHDLNEFYIAVRKNHSPLLSKVLDAEIAQKDVRVMWDIGANIGAITLPLLKRHEKLTAVLFEPSAEVAGRLIRNLANNPDLTPRATIMNIALSDTSGLTEFYVSNEPFNSGTAGLGFSHNRFQFPVRVQTYTGDSLIASGTCAVPALIKIDVEGFEIDVFRGLKQTLADHRPTIIFEHALYRLKERQRARDEVLRFLKSLGYALFRLSDNGAVTPADLEKDGDFVARAI